MEDPIADDFVNSQYQDGTGQEVAVTDFVEGQYGDGTVAATSWMCESCGVDNSLETTVCTGCGYDYAEADVVSDIYDILLYWVM
jgi:hypothetical protein